MNTLLTIFFTEHSLHLSKLSDNKSLSELFSTFFIEKIGKIRMNLSNDVQIIPDIQFPTVKSRMTCFEPASGDGVRELFWIHLYILAKLAILIRSLLNC